MRAIDRAEWIVCPGGRTHAIRSRIGAGLEPVVNEPGVRLVNISGVNGNVRNIAGLEMPAKLFGRERFKTGDVIEFASTFRSHCGAYRADWKGRFTLRGK